MTKLPTEYSFEKLQRMFHIISESNNKIHSCILHQRLESELEETYNVIHNTLMLARNNGMIEIFELPFTNAKLYSLSDFGVMFFAEAEENGYLETWRSYFKKGSETK